MTKQTSVPAKPAGELSDAELDRVIGGNSKGGPVARYYLEFSWPVNR